MGGTFIGFRRFFGIGMILMFKDAGIVAAFFQKLLMGSAFCNASMVQNQNLIRVFQGRDAVGNDENRMCPFQILQLFLYVSVSISTADVVSSRIRMAGSFNRALAREILCFWPPDRPTPRSPTMVS